MKHIQGFYYRQDFHKGCTLRGAQASLFCMTRIRSARLGCGAYFLILSMRSRTKPAPKTSNSNIPPVTRIARSYQARGSNSFGFMPLRMNQKQQANRERSFTASNKSSYFTGGIVTQLSSVQGAQTTWSSGPVAGMTSPISTAGTLAPWRALSNAAASCSAIEISSPPAVWGSKSTVRISSGMPCA